MGLITVEGIRVFAYHGHLPEEKKLVSNFLYNQLCYHIEGFDRLKSFKVAKNILNDL